MRMFRREGWYSFTSSQPYLQVSDVISAHEVSDKVYICKGTPSLPDTFTKTRKNKFCIDIPLGNTSVELKALLDRSAKIYE